MARGDSKDSSQELAAHPHGAEPAAKRSRGRPRNRRSEIDILAAAAELLAAGGYSGVTFEKVAARAGVTRPTIYRRWATKAALIFAVLEANLPATPQLAGDSLLGDLRAIQGHFAQIMAEDGWREAMPGLLADLRADPAAEVMFHRYWRGAVDAAISGAVAGAVEREELTTAPDVSLLGDLLLGPLFFRALMTPASLTQDFVDAVFAQAVRGLTR